MQASRLCEIYGLSQGRLCLQQVQKGVKGMNDLKTLRDKLNGSIRHNEDEAELQAQWDALHQAMEDEQAAEEFERSFNE